MTKRKKGLIIPLYLAAAVLLLGIIYYVTLPPLNIHSPEFWTFFFVCDAVVFVSFFVIKALTGADFVITANNKVSFRSSPNSRKYSLSSPVCSLRCW